MLLLLLLLLVVVVVALGAAREGRDCSTPA
jgi:hypothetical protein